ncbi:MAG: GHKL domain-containing protein [Eubacterium sp.]|nr:GHKL domain-containing protein [Eubacterium sp.]
MTFAYILNHILEAVGVYAFLFLQYPHKRKAWKDWLIILSSYIVLYGIYQFQNLNLNIASMLILYVPLFHYLTSNSWRASFNDALIIFSIIDLSELIVEISSYLFQKDTAFEYGSFSDFIFASLKVKALFVLLLLCLIPVIKNIRKKTPMFHESNFITVSLCLLTMSLIAIQNLGFSTILQSNHLPWIYVLLMAFVVFSVVEIILTVHLQKEHSQLMDVQSALQRKEDDKNYTALVTQLDQEQKVLIHDFKKHLQTISSLVSNRSYNEAQALIEELTSTRALSAGSVLTRNRTLSVLLARYKEFCGEQNIDFVIDVKNANLAYLSPTDVTSLFANLIDNAIEACKASDRAYISLQVHADHSRSLDIISIINTCATNPTFDRNGFLSTNKADKARHGFGIKSIQRVIDHYHGTMDLQYTAEDSLFQITICLYSEVQNDENSHM